MISSRFELREEDVEFVDDEVTTTSEVDKHLAGKHDQSSHAGNNGGSGGGDSQSDDEFVGAVEATITGDEAASKRKLFFGEWRQPSKYERSVEMERPNGTKLKVSLNSYRDTTTKEASADQNHQRMTYSLRLSISHPGAKYQTVLNVAKRSVANKNFLDRSNHAKVKSSVIRKALENYGIAFDLGPELERIGW